jgi:hypothetical protein
MIAQLVNKLVGIDQITIYGFYLGNQLHFLFDIHKIVEGNSLFFILMVCDLTY